jgi:hypothetical protein
MHDLGKVSPHTSPSLSILIGSSSLHLLTSRALSSIYGRLPLYLYSASFC